MTDRSLYTHTCARTPQTLEKLVKKERHLENDLILWSSCLFVLDEVQAIASLIEKQAQIVVKQKEVSEEAKKRKEALLAQYANITDEEEYPYSL